jgi:tetratricopeptide (TPR) repeat protein
LKNEDKYTLHNGINNEKYAMAYGKRAIEKYKLDHHEDSIKDYDAAISLNPKEAVFFYYRGLAKKSLGRYGDSIDDYDKALKFYTEMMGFAVCWRWFVRR